MTMNYLGKLMLGAALLATPSLFGSSAQAQELRFFSGPPQGTWRAFSDQLSTAIRAAAPSEQVTIMPGGGLANVIAIERGQGDIAMAVSTPVYLGLEGIGPFPEATQDVRLLATLFYMPYHILTLNSSIQSVEDLRGKRVSVAPKGYASEALTESILPVAGLSYDDIEEQFLGEVESGEALRNGQIDAFMITGDTDYSVALELSTTGRLNLVSFSDEQLERIITTSKGLFPYTLEAGHYGGLEEPYNTFAVSVMLVANANLADDRAQAITKAVVENLPELKQLFGSFRAMTPEEMGRDVGVPIHPGALAYYEEAAGSD